MRVVLGYLDDYDKPLSFVIIVNDGDDLALMERLRAADHREAYILESYGGDIEADVISMIEDTNEEHDDPDYQPEKEDPDENAGSS